jgi:CrcB protein
MTLLAVALASAVGAPARYLVDRFVALRNKGGFPWGTLVINVTGAFALGALVGMGAHHGLSKQALAILGTGFCGAYTTFSTFSVETVRLVEERAFEKACLNVAVSLGAGLLAGAAGLGLAQ